MVNFGGALRKFFSVGKSRVTIEVDSHLVDVIDTLMERQGHQRIEGSDPRTSTKGGVFLHYLVDSSHVRDTSDRLLPNGRFIEGVYGMSLMPYGTAKRTLAPITGRC